MDTQTLADWVGADHTGYDLDAAVDALERDGITDPNDEPDRTRRILAEQRREAAWQTVEREHRAAVQADKTAAAHRRRRDDAIRALVVSGESRYAVAKQLGLSQAYVGKVVSGATP